MAQFKKTVAENSVVEVIHLTVAFLENLNKFEGALNFTLETIEEVSLNHAEIGLIAKQIELAEFYDNEILNN